MAPSKPFKKKQAARNATPNQGPVLRRVAGNASLRNRTRHEANPKNDRPLTQSDTLDNYYQEMSQVDVAMEFFNNTISENMAGVDLEIKTRVKNSKAGKNAASVTQHVAQMLSTPPESPVTPRSSKSKRSGNPEERKAHRGKRAKIYQALLKDKSFGSLSSPG